MSKIKTFQKNKTGKDYVVGDIHGCHKLLMKKLHKMSFDFKNDRLFSVGDLIDRGPENEACLNLIYENWFFPVMGNHEVFMFDAIANKRDTMWLQNGGMWAVFSDLYIYEKDFWAQEISNLIPYAIEIEDGNKKIGIVHAEPTDDWNDVVDFCNKNYSLLDITNDNVPEKDNKIFIDMTWSRKRIKNNIKNKVKNINKVFVGHTIVKRHKKLGNVHYIDSGAFTTGRITIKKIKF